MKVGELKQRLEGVPDDVDVHALHSSDQVFDVVDHCAEYEYWPYGFNLHLESKSSEVLSSGLSRRR